MSNKYSAVIFDMDGTLIDSRKVIEQAWRHGASLVGLAISEQDMEAHVHGRSAEHTLKYFFGHLDQTKVAEIKDAVNRYEEHATSELIEGAKAFLQELKLNHVKIGLCTGSWRERVNFVFAEHELAPFFDAVVTREDVNVGKPNPEGFLKCANVLGVPIDQCLIFEDSTSGIQAAHASGTDCVVIGSNIDVKQKPILKQAPNFIGLSLASLL